MTGGQYITIFQDDCDRETRAFIYKLETLGIVKLDREKDTQRLLFNTFLLKNCESTQS